MDCFWILVIGLATFVLWKLLLSKKDQSPKLKIPDWDKDKVYLFQFPCCRSVRSVSPFAIKLETWLRLQKIPYENVYTSVMGPKGQIPYIELNGRVYSDSNVIIDFLEKHFNKESYPSWVSKEDGALAHALISMLENHTAVAGFYWRYGFHIDEFFRFALSGRFDGLKGKIIKALLSMKIRLRAYLHGMGRHSLEDVAAFTFKDLRALSDILGEKKFFLGDEPTLLDCTVFGNLLQFLFPTLDFPQKSHMKNDCPNLLNFVDRMKDALWPDWEEMCDRKCMKKTFG